MPFRYKYKTPPYTPPPMPKIKPRQQTNGDRIRAMSDEELAELLRDAYEAGSNDAEAWRFGEGHRCSFEWDLEWLRKPAKE